MRRREVHGAAVQGLGWRLGEGPTGTVRAALQPLVAHRTSPCTSRDSRGTVLVLVCLGKVSMFFTKGTVAGCDVRRRRGGPALCSHVPIGIPLAPPTRNAERPLWAWAVCRLPSFAESERPPGGYAVPLYNGAPRYCLSHASQGLREGAPGGYAEFRLGCLGAVLSGVFAVKPRP